VVVGCDADATTFLALNHGQCLGCYFHSTCSLAWVRRGCWHGRYLCSLLLPCQLCPNLHSGLDTLFVALAVTRSGASLYHQRRGLANGDGFWDLRWNPLHWPIRF
jgi:hypothetical protein